MAKDTTTTEVPKWKPSTEKKRQILTVTKMRGYVLPLGNDRVGPDRCELDVPLETAVKYIQMFEDRPAIRKAAGIHDPNASYQRHREARAKRAREARDEERKAIGLAVASALAEHLGKAATK
jgi:hypothetical protein